MINYKEIQSFRDAIEEARDDRCFKDRLRGFPDGCCDDSSELLAFYLKSKGINTVEVTAMNKSRDRHVWLEDDQGIIMDLTADQFFGDGLYIGDYNSFYKSLEIVSKKKPYDISQHRNLSYDYECILNYI